MIEFISLMLDWMPPELKAFFIAIFVIFVLALFFGIISKILHLLRG